MNTALEKKKKEARDIHSGERKKTKKERPPLREKKRRCAEEYKEQVKSYGSEPRGRTTLPEGRPGENRGDEKTKVLILAKKLRRQEINEP